MVEMKKGTKGHLFFGHGPTVDCFEKRDHGSTNTQVYEKLQRTQQIIDPHNFVSDKKPLDKLQTNAKP